MNFLVILNIIETFIYVFLISALVGGLQWLWSKDVRASSTLFIFATVFSAAGATSGYFSGISRVAIAGEVVPAILVFIASGVVYIYSQDARRGLLAAVVVFIFIFSFHSQYFLAAYERSQYEANLAATEASLETARSIRDECVEVLLSEKFETRSDLEKTRVQVLCAEYVPFLQ